jgi:hypothetical protein
MLSTWLGVLGFFYHGSTTTATLQTISAPSRRSILEKLFSPKQKEFHLQPPPGIFSQKLNLHKQKEFPLQLQHPIEKV